MLQENKILTIASKNKGIVTTKEITENNIPRIYLTNLIRDHKLYRIDRGIYSIKLCKVDPFYALQHKSPKIIFSHFTSLYLQGFYKNIDKIEQICVNQGYNAKNLKNYKVFYNSNKNYTIGLTTIERDKKLIKVYDIERCVCDIIKDHTRFDESSYNKFINYYFNRNDINYKKLLEYSRLLRISHRVHHYLSLFKA